MVHEAQETLQQVCDDHSTQVEAQVVRVQLQHGPEWGAAGGQHYIVGRHLLLTARQRRVQELLVLPDHLQLGGYARIKVISL